MVMSKQADQAEMYRRMSSLPFIIIFPVEEKSSWFRDMGKKNTQNLVQSNNRKDAMLDPCTKLNGQIIVKDNLIFICLL